MKVRAFRYTQIVVLVVSFGFEAGPVTNRAPAAQPAVSGGPRIDGLAAMYVNDAGIQKDPAVVFADDFESWDAEGTQNP